MPVSGRFAKTTTAPIFGARESEMILCNTQLDLELEETADLVLRAIDGDREAFGQLVERFERLVFQVALRRLRDYGEAQELSQEVFVQALRKLDQLREPEHFGSWLKSITVRMAINRAVRRRYAQAAEPSLLAATCIEHETPVDRALGSERRAQVRDGLRQLRPLDRSTLEAFYVDGESLIEMSDRFKAPVGTIKRRLHVARKRLAEVLQETVGA